MRLFHDFLCNAPLKIQKLSEMFAGNSCITWRSQPFEVGVDPGTVDYTHKLATWLQISHLVAESQCTVERQFTIAGSMTASPLVASDLLCIQRVILYILRF
jgi:hypothetical protein